VLGIAILLIPTLILLVNEFRWKQEEAFVPDPDRVSLRSRIGQYPRRYLIGGGILLAVFIWTFGTNGPGLVVGLVVALAVLAWFLWAWHRSVMESVRRDLQPPEQP
jgi:hypothetical protein